MEIGIGKINGGDSIGFGKLYKIMNSTAQDNRTDLRQRELDNGSGGVVFNVQRFSINDGPGIRTVVFLKGCPLRCLWCFNPESQKQYPELITNDEICIRCNKCIELCAVNAIKITEGGKSIDRRVCSRCGKCAEGCVSGAIRMVGEYNRLEKIVAELERDKAFYDNSGGGVTLSGGECLSQPHFSKRILEQCKKLGINTAIETCGYVEEWDLFQEVLGYTDLVLFDIKHMDSNKHRELTGVSNSIILQNLKHVAITKTPLVIRITIIPGYNDSKENITATIDSVRRYLTYVEQIDLLPFNQLGRNKYKGLNLNYRLEQLKPPDKDQMQRLREIVESYGFSVSIGG